MAEKPCMPLDLYLFFMNASKTNRPCALPVFNCCFQANLSCWQIQMTIADDLLIKKCSKYFNSELVDSW